MATAAPKCMTLAEFLAWDDGTETRHQLVRGHVMGSVRGRRVMLQASCHVEGDVFHQALSIEQGAYFEGKSRRTPDPLAEAAQRPAADALPRPAVAAVPPSPAGTVAVGPPTVVPKRA